jgi:hypothetical protein
MGFVIKGRSSIFLKTEVTEGVYAAPASAADAVEVLEDFSGFEYKRDTIERSVLADTVESIAPRNGLPDVTGKLPTEFKAGPTEGSSPRGDVLYKSLLGGKRSVSAAVTSTTGHSTTVINLADADINKFKFGDSVLFKVSGNYFVRPVKSVSNVLGSVSITLDVPAPIVVPDNTVIAPLVTYFFDSTDSSFSVAGFLGGEINERASGCKVESGEISNWQTGAIPQVAFGLKALSLVKVDESPAFSPDFSLEPAPPVALDACAYIDGVEIDYNEFSLKMDNTLTDILSACSSSGKIGARNTNFKVGGKINPYMKDNSVTRFDKYNTGDPASMFLTIANPSSVVGEIKNIACVYMPQVVFTSITNGDQDGVMTDELEFQAYKKLGKDTVFISFI